MEVSTGACRHKLATWICVSADQVREQTYIKMDKISRGLKGLTMSGDRLAICAHVSLTIESMYSADDETKEENYKEEGENHVYKELIKLTHPLKTANTSLYNIINDKAGNVSANVQEADKIGESMFLDVRSYH